MRRYLVATYIAIIVSLLGISLIGQSVARVRANSSSGMITGHLINGTENGPVPIDQEVRLQAYTGEINSGEAVITHTDNNGEFKFEDLDASGEYDYVVSVSYQYADYYSERLVFDQNTVSHSVDLQVFEATESNDAITMRMAGTILYPQTDMMVVTEYVSVQNTADTTYIGTPIDGMEDRRQTLRLPLPDDVIELQAEAGFLECCTLMMPDSIIDTLPRQFSR